MAEAVEFGAVAEGDALGGAGARAHGCENRKGGEGEGGAKFKAWDHHRFNHHPTTVRHRLNR